MNTDLVAATELRATCTRDELAGALGVVARGLSSRGAVQVLSGILLQADGETLTLASTDMEISLRASVGGSVSGDGAVVVPGRLLTDLVRLLPDESVTLSHEEGEGVLNVTSGSHASRLNVYSAEDFPRLPPLDVVLHRIAAPALLETIEKVRARPNRDPRSGKGIVGIGPVGDQDDVEPERESHLAASRRQLGGRRERRQIGEYREARCHSVAASL